MAEAYESVIRGKLRLKGKSLAIKKKKKRSRKNLSKFADVEDDEGAPLPPYMLPPPAVDDPRTEAEKKFDAIQEEREMKRLEKMVEKTHKQKIEEMNQHLDSLPTHFDLPKVGPG